MVSVVVKAVHPSLPLEIDTGFALRLRLDGNCLRDLEAALENLIVGQDVHVWSRHSAVHVDFATVQTHDLQPFNAHNLLQSSVSGLLRTCAQRLVTACFPEVRNLIVIGRLGAGSRGSGDAGHRQRVAVVVVVHGAGEPSDLRLLLRGNAELWLGAGKNLARKLNGSERRANKVDVCPWQDNFGIKQVPWLNF